MNKEYLQKFAKNLKAIRKAKTDLTISTAKSIADSLNVHIKDLFDFDQPKIFYAKIRI